MGKVCSRLWRSRALSLRSTTSTANIAEARQFGPSPVFMKITRHRRATACTLLNNDGTTALWTCAVVDSLASATLLELRFEIAPPRRCPAALHLDSILPDVRPAGHGELGHVSVQLWGLERKDVLLLCVYRIWGFCYFFSSLFHR